MPLVDYSNTHSFAKGEFIAPRLGCDIMLKVSPRKGVIHFGKREKFNPRSIGPFKKHLSDEPLAISLDEIHIDDKLHFVEEPVEIMDRE
nr:hypothetical protein [Tanacetum cinerariifolium]